VKARIVRKQNEKLAVNEERVITADEHETDIKRSRNLLGLKRIKEELKKLDKV
jgi:hypothetical protein